MSFTKLFEPGRIGGLEIPNRIVYSPMSLRSTDGRGHYTEQAVASLEERARGGAGLVVAPAAMAWASSTGYGVSVSVAEDEAIPHLAGVAARIQKYGARAALQIGARGTRAEGGAETVAPTAMRFGYEARVPRELGVEEIAHFVACFGQAARRAREAGFDAVLLHACTGKLLSMFMSPYSNRRTDRYGGSLANRMRFPLEALAAMKAAAGEDFPVIVRISVDERLGARGIERTEGVRMAALLDRAGADGIQVVSGTQEGIWTTSCGYLYPEGYARELNAPVKRAVAGAVIASGKLGNPDLAEAMLNNGEADFISLGRPLLVDAQWPRKVRAGRTGDIRRCIGCLNCFTFASRPDIEPRGVSCTMNPGVLREPGYEPLIPTGRPRRVLVVGGGLAGMEAAATLAARGHTVDLYESADRPGGQWIAASAAPYKADYRFVIPWLEERMKRLGVRVHLGRAVDRALLERERPEVVVLASGALPRGLPRPEKGPVLVQGVDIILRGAGLSPVRTGKRVVVVGGRYIGMEAALDLARDGAHVSLIDALDIGHGTNPRLGGVYRNRLVEYGVYLYPNTPLLGFTADGVDVAHLGSLLHLPADTVVLAIGTVPRRDLIGDLEELGLEYHAIGDCRNMGDALYALRDGADLGRRL